MDNTDVVEKLLHDALGDRRVLENREFYEVDPMRVISALKLAGGEKVTPADDVGEDQGGFEAANQSTKKQSRFNFEIVDIPAGSVLTYYEDETITATVHNRNKIIFEGEVMSLSVAALTLINRFGRNWTAAAGPLYWMFDGETLNERRARMEREAEEADE